MSLNFSYDKNIINENIYNNLSVIPSMKQLISLENVKNNKVVWVNGKQGGFFKYNKNKKNINDGCLIFNGWVRQTTSQSVNILWCGAQGNGKIDDTNSFNRALKVAYLYRSQNKSLYLPTGTYRISKPIVIPRYYKEHKNDYFTIYGDGSYDAGQTQIYFVNPGIGQRDDPMQYWIDSKIQALTIRDIRFKQLIPNKKSVYHYAPYTLLRAKPSKNLFNDREATADTDTAIMNCTFSHFYTVVENWGRGLHFSENTASLGHNTIVLHWDKYPEFPKGIGKDSTGFRAFNITNNRFHSNRGFAVVNMGKNAKKIHSIIISNNLLDIGGGIFKGVLVDGIISNTVASMTPKEVLHLFDGSHNYQINGLTSSSAKNINRIPNYFIIIKGKQKNAQFNNITLDSCKKDAFYITGRLTGVSFNNINVNNIQSKNSIFEFSNHKQMVTINNLFYLGKNRLPHPIRSINKKAYIRVNNYVSLDTIGDMDY